MSQQTFHRITIIMAIIVAITSVASAIFFESSSKARQPVVDNSTSGSSDAISTDIISTTSAQTSKNDSQASTTENSPALVEYDDAKLNYHFAYPASWARSNDTDGSVVLKRDGAEITIGATGHGLPFGMKKQEFQTKIDGLNGKITTFEDNGKIYTKVASIEISTPASIIKANESESLLLIEINGNIDEDTIKDFDRMVESIRIKKMKHYRVDDIFSYQLEYPKSYIENRDYEIFKEAKDGIGFKKNGNLVFSITTLSVDQKNDQIKNQILKVSSDKQKVNDNISGLKATYQGEDAILINNVRQFYIIRSAALISENHPLRNEFVEIISSLKVKDMDYR